MSGYNIEDLVNILPIAFLLGWALVLILVEAFVKRRGLTMVLAAVGLAAAIVMAAMQFGVETSAFKNMVWWSRTLLTGHIVLALVFVLTGNWILLFLVTFAPFIATWFKLLTHMPQHIGMRPDVADWRQSTRSYIGGPIVRFFYWNMNYHVEHHMYAAVPYYNLPKLRRHIEADLPVAARGLVATWREIFETIRRQRADPGYFYTPELPEGAGRFVE